MYYKNDVMYYNKRMNTVNKDSVPDAKFYVTRHFLRQDMFNPDDETDVALAGRIAEYVMSNTKIPNGCSNNITFRNMFTTEMLDIIAKIDAINGRKEALTTPIHSMLVKYYDTQDSISDMDSIIQEPNCNSVCPKCKEKKVFMEAVQTRAIDEPLTIFHKCLNCGHGF